jgi:hypothetical protein
MQSENPWSQSRPEGRYLSAGISGRISQGSLTVFCSPEQRAQGEQILVRAEDCLTQVGHFFGAGFQPELVVCLYPGQAEMEQAFGRQLPGDQCCFAPIKGPWSLVAFTSRIAQDHLMQVLAHEISHVYFTLMTGNREVNEVQQTVPVWLDEGLALWVDGHFRRDLRGVRARRRALLQEGLRRGDSLRLRDMYTYFNRLDPGEEFGPKGQMACAFSDSCVTRLMEVFGIESVFRFLELLQDGADFERAFLRHFRTELEQFNEEMVREVLGHG